MSKVKGKGWNREAPQDLQLWGADTTARTEEARGGNSVIPAWQENESLEEDHLAGPMVAGVHSQRQENPARQRGSSCGKEIFLLSPNSPPWTLSTQRATKPVA